MTSGPLDRACAVGPLDHACAVGTLDRARAATPPFGMLHGKLVRSTIAHGRIASIDIGAAQSTAGVQRVVTGADLHDPASSVLARDIVRYLGEPVAVVLAADPQVAAAAAQTIAVAYQPLPAIVDEVEAVGAQAVAHAFTLRLGQVDRAFAEAEHVVEHSFRTRTVITPTDEPLAALAIALGVAIAPAPAEPGDSRTAHATTIRIKSAVTSEGRITARRCAVYWNGGAADDVGPLVAQTSGLTAAGPYEIDDLLVDSMVLRTNLPPAGPLRGAGIPQLAWAYESHTDLLARALGWDPFDFRRRNIRRDGIRRDGRPPAIDAVLATLESRMDWRMRFARGGGAIRRGRGVAIGAPPSGATVGTGAEVEVDLESGRVRVTRLITATDVGCAILDDLDVDAGQACNAALAGDAIPGLVVDGDAASATVAVAPAIANAIDDATGVRLTALPLTPGAFQRGLRGRIGTPLPANAP